MQLATHITLPVIVAGCLGASAAIIANLTCFVMVGKVNERSAENEKISYLSWGSEVRTRFKQLYPEDKLVLLRDSCMVLMILCFIALIRFWVFGL
jgi:argonaute-like protein implicated in RNA metabolism and viral defense